MSALAETRLLPNKLRCVAGVSQMQVPRRQYLLIVVARVIRWKIELLTDEHIQEILSRAA